VIINDTSGKLQVKVDGELDIDFSGDTKPGSNTDITKWRIIGGWSGYPHHYFDDIAINDTAGSVDNSWCGDAHIYPARSNGAGNYTQLSIGGSSPPASNYQAVDENSPNGDTDYVYSSTIGDKDTYTLDALSSQVTEYADGVDIQRIIVHLRSKEDTAASGTVAPMIRTGSTDYTGTYQSLLTSYTKDISEEWRLNPRTLAAWTTAEIDALEAGVIVG